MNQVGDSIEIQKVVQSWIQKIENSGIKIYVRNDKNASSYSDSIIRISCTKNSSKGVGVLWDLLHEFGHHLDQDCSMLGFTPRELRAWEIARKLIKEEGVYYNDVLEFDCHMNSKLRTYRVDELLRFTRAECNILLINGDEKS